MGILVESSSYYNGGNDENDDDYFPTIEELLHNELRKEGFGVAEPETEHTIRGVVEEDLGKASSIDQSISALSDSYSGDQGEHG